jgi:hypothetical protein
MRLEPICELRMKYEEGVWLAPFQADERQGYGKGGGLVTGANLPGTMRWSNHPRRRRFARPRIAANKGRLWRTPHS